MLLIKLHNADLQGQQQKQHDSGFSTAVLFDSCLPWAGGCACDWN
jgi:hypothetical protein